MGNSQRRQGLTPPRSKAWSSSPSSTQTPRGLAKSGVAVPTAGLPKPDKPWRTWSRSSPATPTHRLLADALVQDQALDDAESLLRAATNGLGQQPNAVGLWHRLAHLLAQRGDKRKALIALQNGLQLVPSDSACALAKATLLLEAGQPEAALQTVNPYWAISPMRSQHCNARPRSCNSWVSWRRP